MRREWEDKVVELLCAHTIDLRELAYLAGADPTTFYIGARFNGADLRGQDLRGMNLEPDALSGAIMDENTLVEADQPEPPTDVAHTIGLGRGRSNDLAMVIGSGTTQVFTPRRGLVLHEGSVLALRKGRNQEIVQATGDEAQRMIGREPGHLRTIRPIEHDLISDPRTTELMIRAFLDRSASLSRIVAPRVVLAIPSGLTPVQKRSFREVCTAAGIRQAYLVSRAIAAALGASLPSHANTIGVLDFGEGSTDVAILGAAEALALDSVRTGLIAFDAALAHYVRRNNNLIIGEATAANIRTAIGSAVLRDRDVDRSMSVIGRDIFQGVPREIRLSTRQYTEAIAGELAELANFVNKMIERAGARFELNHSGVVLTGMGADLPNLAWELSLSIGVPVTVAPAPSQAVIRGAGVILSRPKLLRALSRVGGDVGFGLFDLRDDLQVASA